MLEGDVRRFCLEVSMHCLRLCKEGNRLPLLTTPSAMSGNAKLGFAEQNLGKSIASY